MSEQQQSPLAAGSSDAGLPAGATAVRRLAELDALRAFALLGIFLVNVQFFADPARFEGLPTPQDPAGTAVLAFVAALFTGKFYILFSFLFGYSFVLLWNACHQRGQDIVPVALRRFGSLLALGLAHGLLLFTGDILVGYAIGGAVLLASRAIRVRTATRLGIWIVAAIGVLMGLLAGLMALIEPWLASDPAFTAALEAAARPAEEGHLASNLALYPTTLGGILVGQVPLVLGLFFLGLASGKARLLERGITPRTLRRTALTGLAVGLPGAAVSAWGAELSQSYTGFVAAFAASTLTGPFLTAAYVCLLLLAFRTAPGGRLRAALAPAGRMALSNYLAQSVVMCLVFTDYGLDLAGALHPGSVVALCLGVYALQLAVSALWMARFGYGPVEGLLRAATYWRRPTWAPRSADTAA
ncbi:DUF418 domain-containing protein [Zafaria sp. J156]|uniref:DUF418 domain-containing protein n=1 Tax=Zafaria sp. J156 TaxID=3116490 RepID=UPI002E77057B|nr:DUF418 domain-containing protein [Zafaria sp. J156]MEE1621513.1 DUF418 domain-containing protein [Zafaria sp. J156]